MKIIISGPKSSGKSTIGRQLAAHLGIRFFESDTCIEELYAEQTGISETCREIWKSGGDAVFRSFEKQAVTVLSKEDWCLIATGGGTLLDPESRESLLENSLFVMIEAENEFLWNRMCAIGLPPFYSGTDGFALYKEKNNQLYQALRHRADVRFLVNAENECAAHECIAKQIETVMQQRMFAPNTFGEILRVTTFGESHGAALGAVVDGLPAGIELSELDIQSELDRRRPGQSAVSTPRSESDAVHFLSGVFEGKTTGTPLCMVVYNCDQDSARYDSLRGVFRPGHADFTFWKKFGMRDHRGGGRSSGRETIGRVAAGACAKKILAEKGILITAFAEEVAGIRGAEEDFSFIEKNPVRAADQKAATRMEDAILEAKKCNDSVGGIVKIIIKNVPAGLGDPVFYKLDARLAQAMVSLGAVKGVEFGAGFASARMTGSENNDSMCDSAFCSNNAGGILGGIATGGDIIMRIAVKPTPSIAQEQKTMTVCGENTEVVVHGRHDPCIVPRIIPVVESMAAVVLLDAYYIQMKLHAGYSIK